ncbi:MAG: 30S ribosomal protein S16 [Dehalococcoidia bacterium]
MIRIRLKRIGKKRHPFYRVIVADKPVKRDGRFIENLGSYDPHADPPAIVIDSEKAKEWIAKGAQPSESAEKILVRAGVLEKKAPVVKAKLEVKRAEQAKAAEARAKVRAAEAEKAAKAEAAAAEADAAKAAEAEAPAEETAAEATEEATAEE